MWLLQLSFLVALALAEHHDDPEMYMTTPQQIQYWGYPAETHHATTPDGFILEMHRIPHGKTAFTGNGTRPIVFMQHGLLACSSNWIDNLPNEAAGFLFADAGFDVWLGNFRGNTYSNAHTKYNMSQEKFWEWTWDEMGMYDLQTMIEYAMQVGGQERVYYIGHSQGTLTMFSKLSVDQAFTTKIRKFFALAPIGSVKNIKGLMAEVARNTDPEMELWNDLFGSRDFLPDSPFMKALAKKYCDGNMIKEDLCDDFFFSMAGPESKQWNTTRIPVYSQHNPAGTSSRNILHWMQMVKKGTVSRFDYGSKGNKQHYGSTTPPAYDFSRIQNQIYLYWGDDDYLGDPTDIHDYLLKNLPFASLKLNQELPEYNHFDFIWGLRATNDIYKQIINIINNDLTNPPPEFE